MSITITPIDIKYGTGTRRTVLVKYSGTSFTNLAASQIANNTAQTWQQNRGRQETLANTKQGKIAEELFQSYVSQSYPEINMLSYDEIRNDNYMKHAPFDFLVWGRECNIDMIIGSIQNDIAHSDRYVNLSPDTRKLCQIENVKIIEVKSTKITDRHKQRCSFNRGDYNDLPKVAALSRTILEKDDFLTYPHYCRSTPKYDYSVNNYIGLLQSKGFNINNEEEMRCFECWNQTADIFVRVYVDEAEQAGLLMGWISKEYFYQNAIIKKMPQNGKSEAALYFATSLLYGQPFDCFPCIFNT